MRFASGAISRLGKRDQRQEAQIWRPIMSESAEYRYLCDRPVLLARGLSLTGSAPRRRDIPTTFVRRVGAVALAVGLIASAPAAENEKEKRFPLEPPDTSSPRATLTTFIDNVNETYRLYRVEGLTYKNQARFQNLMPYIFGTLDLSQIPPTQLRSTGPTAAVLIKEVLDRIEVPPYEDIPDAAAMKALAEAGEPPRWRIPHTEITIARMKEGPQQGEYVFTAETVAKAEQYYQRVKHLPYKEGASPGLYDIVRYAPGWMISERWLFALPRWAREPIYNQAIWQWILLALLLVLGVALPWLVHRATHRGRGRRTWHWHNLTTALAVIAVARVELYLIDRQIGITGDVLMVINTLLWAAIFVAASAAVLAIGTGIAALIMASPRIKAESIDAHMVRMSTQLVSMLVVFYIVIAGVQFLGIPLTPLLAGLGVGGLAVALAARPTLENFIGGVTLFADKPVRVGDPCVFNNRFGFVEEIGLRSTRIRTLDRTIVSVPNSQFAELQLENFNRRDCIRFYTVLPLRYETTPEQLRYVLAKVRELLLAHPKISNTPPLPNHVRFVGPGEHSLNIEIFSFSTTADWGEFLGIREDLLLRIMDIVKEAGTGLAIPAQTTYLTRDRTLDAEHTRAAEAEVEAWRRDGTLPFPWVSDARQADVTDKLDYPPPGTPSGPSATPRALSNSSADKARASKKQR
jgi:MscS family membrane protein